MARHLPPFEKLADDIWGEIVWATNNFDLLKSLLFPMGNQPRVRADFPFIVGTLRHTVTEHLLLAVCRLLDPKRDPRLASLSTLLLGAAKHHATEINVTDVSRQLRSQFEGEVPARLAELKARWKKNLTLHRNGYLAHRDLTKLELLPPLKYKDIRESIEWAQGVYAAYAGAYRSRACIWRLPEMATEPAYFLKWSRLDDYQMHVDAEARALKARHYPPGAQKSPA